MIEWYTGLHVQAAIYLYMYVGPMEFDMATKLQYYAFYKQATIGKVNTTQPWMIDTANRAKW